MSTPISAMMRKTASKNPSTLTSWWELIMLTSVLMLSLSVADARRDTRHPTAPPQPQQGPVMALERVRPDLAELSVPISIPFVGYKLEFQLVGGPDTEGSTSDLTFPGKFRVGDRDTRRNTYPVLLLPDTQYTVRARYTKTSVDFSPYIKTSVDFSPWTSLTFTTTSDFASRPGSPLNLRVKERLASGVRLEWDAPTPGASISYEYFINGVKTPLSRCGGVHFSCTEADFRNVFVPFQLDGKSLTFGVAARDSDLNLSLPSEFVVSMIWGPSL